MWRQREAGAERIGQDALYGNRPYYNFGQRPPGTIGERIAGVADVVSLGLSRWTRGFLGDWWSGSGDWVDTSTQAYLEGVPIGQMGMLLAGGLAAGAESTAASIGEGPAPLTSVSLRGIPQFAPSALTSSRIYTAAIVGNNAYRGTLNIRNGSADPFDYLGVAGGVLLLGGAGMGYLLKDSPAGSSASVNAQLISTYYAKYNLGSLGSLSLSGVLSKADLPGLYVRVPAGELVNNLAKPFANLADAYGRVGGIWSGFPNALRDANQLKGQIGFITLEDTFGGRVLNSTQDLVISIGRKTGLDPLTWDVASAKYIRTVDRSVLFSVLRDNGLPIPGGRPGSTYYRIEYPFAERNVQNIYFILVP